MFGQIERKFNVKIYLTYATESKFYVKLGLLCYGQDFKQIKILLLLPSVTLKYFHAFKLHKG